MNSDGRSGIIFLLYMKGQKNMDELIKFLTSKIGYTLTFIFGCLLPGNIMIFALDRQLYLQIDIIKLFFLSSGIPVMIFIPNFILIVVRAMIRDKMREYKALKDKEFEDIELIIIMSIAFTIIEIYILVICKMLISKFQIKSVLSFSCKLFFAFLVLLAILYEIVCFINWIHKKLEKRGNNRRVRTDEKTDV